jgi:serine/threonine-protein kinase PpkA
MQVPGYQIERLVAEGGMSTVYRAVQASLGRPVALKLLKHIDSLQEAERFLREARIVAALEHRNIVTIHDVGSVGERYYIAMEFLEGGCLADRIEHGLPLEQALDLAEAIAGCLDFVHRRGIVHRDIKPGNILFHADGTPKLSDFGIAKELEDDQEGTMAGRCFGSPYYLSPEQAEGRPLDGRSDIYSLGIVFYQMLTGRRPYAESSHIETIVAHLSHPIPVLPQAFAHCQRLLEDMIAKDPANRIASAAALVERMRALRALRAPDGTSAAPAPGSSAGAGVSRAGHARLPIALLSLAGAAGAVGLGWWLAGDDPDEAQSAATAALSHFNVIAPPQTAQAVATGEAVPPSQLDQVGHAAVIAPRIEPPAAPEAIAPAPVGIGDSPEPPAVTAQETGVPAEGHQVHMDTEQEQDASPVEPVQIAGLEADTAQPGVAVAEPAKVEPATVEPAAADDGAARIDSLMRLAKEDFQALRLTRPAGNSAHDRYREVLGLEPGHIGALAGIDAIAARYAVMADKALSEDDRERAALYLRRGRQVRSDHPDLVAAEAALARRETPPEETAPVVVEAAAEPREESLRGPGSGNMVKDFQKLWRSVFD